MRDLFDCIFLDVGHDHVGARLGQRRRDTEADAGGCTGDDCGFAGDVLHRERAFLGVGDGQPTAVRKMRM